MKGNDYRYYYLIVVFAFSSAFLIRELNMARKELDEVRDRAEQAEYMFSLCKQMCVK